MHIGESEVEALEEVGEALVVAAQQVEHGGEEVVDGGRVFLDGGFKHGQHLQFDQTDNTPLCNLFVSMLQKVDSDQFASSSGSFTDWVF